jgi:hypothetical protein
MPSQVNKAIHMRGQGRTTTCGRPLEKAQTSGNWEVVTCGQCRRLITGYKPLVRPQINPESPIGATYK